MELHGPAPRRAIQSRVPARLLERLLRSEGDLRLSGRSLARQPGHAQPHVRLGAGCGRAVPSQHLPCPDSRCPLAAGTSLPAVHPIWFQLWVLLPSAQRLTGHGTLVTPATSLLAVAGSRQDRAAGDTSERRHSALESACFPATEPSPAQPSWTAPPDAARTPGCNRSWTAA